MVSRISLRDDGRVDGVIYIDREGKNTSNEPGGHRLRIRDRNAATAPQFRVSGHRHGLANSSGTLGKYLMAQAGNVVAGRFEELIRLYKAPPAHALTEEFYETDPIAVSLAALRSRRSDRCQWLSRSRWLRPWAPGVGVCAAS